MAAPLEVQSFGKDFDWTLFAAALLLALIGLTGIYSATMNIPDDVSFMKQAIFVCAGIALMFVIASVDYHTLAEHIPWLYLGSLAVLIYTPLAARKIAGARSWIDLGPVSIQPSEMVKMVVVVAMARYLSDLHMKGYLNFRQILKAGIICGIPMGLILLQPDMGTALSYVPILGVGLLIRGLRPAVILSVVLLVLVVVPVGAFVMSDHLKPHQKERLLTFIDPSRDPQGQGFQVQQSKIAIGSGGLLGKGIFKGSQSQLGFLPARHTDFIFSVVGEEMGFVGVLGTLGLIGFVLFRSLHNAQTARDSLGLFIIMGVVGVFFFHTIVNVAMVIGLFPVVGIPLPFLSYGGSSILTAFIGLGLVINVRRRRYVN
ncbi:MAG TPA: rod shape-determining protein RodA [Terriglobia bacterium]|nr:rod shape-determining protein RodA [Terriglobia bacterium]